MKLNGAIVNFLGDSITEGVGASCEGNRYTDVLAREFGLARANNYGVSGSRIARQTVMTNEPHDRDFCMRMAEMDENADAVVVFGGTNDYATEMRRWACPLTGPPSPSGGRATG